MAHGEERVPEVPLSIALLPEGAALPGAVRVEALAGAEAALDLAPERAALSVALPARPRAELRFIVDRVLAGLSGLVRVGEVELRGGGVDDDTLMTIGLDLHQRTGGRLELPDRPDLAARVRWDGALEEAFRAWVNEDPATRTSVAIARDAVSWAGDRRDVETTVLAEEELAEQGLRLLLAVGGGSEASPPRLVLARYTPEGGDRGRAPLALVGKGITFDSGGINVKPYESFVSTMKNDMAGAALAFTLFRALVEAGHPEPLLLVIPTCENAIDARSMRPGALVESYAGILVRIDHTDAEGRLVLADGIAYACRHHQPRQILCFATLTTSALISYGPFATPVHFADPAFERRLREASERTGEDMHFFPARVWHAEANRDREAALRNTARLPGDASRGAGSRNAAHFLAYFADAPLCHFDIFGSTWNWSGEAPGAGYGATGAPLRTLLRAFELD